MADELLTVQRALDVLGLFTSTEGAWGVSEVARRLDLGTSQAHRILATLAGRGFVVPDPRTRLYRLGPALIGLGQLAAESDGTRQIALPVLHRLAASTGRSAVLNVRQGSRYQLTAAADAPGDLRWELTLGRSYPWYGGASGHAIYAFRPEAEVDALLATGFEESTRSGPRRAEEIRERHRLTREQGWAYSCGEVNPHVTSLAAPIRVSGEVSASVSVIGVTRPLEVDPALIDQVLSAARELSALLR
ncbi:IclR family transcriptional regulator [Kineosporia sp. J2-2]|uniref:IclR family transcriptional regulator n=1 Tax=Kineosporia corallincola TaxID=2835133 RepID=A0ABS5TME2_9ACTN|nr:IclR family transcriptional regulator [Kineosporia corallincola]MBT0772013.1 IclR family transcriptional regulator [Kineosporia corallincola]